MADAVKKIVVELDEVDPKKQSVKFSSDDAPETLKNVYIGNAAIKKLGGCPDGVKITIEAL